MKSKLKRNLKQEEIVCNNLTIEHALNIIDTTMRMSSMKDEKVIMRIDPAWKIRNADGQTFLCRNCDDNESLF